MEPIIQKWTEAFQLNEPSCEPLHFELFTHFLSRFRKTTEETLTDHCNEEVINQRVLDRTAMLSDTISKTEAKLEESVTELNEKTSQNKLLREEVSHYKRLVEDERVSVHKKIEEAIRSRDESMADYINELKQDKVKLETRCQSFQDSLTALSDTINKRDTKVSHARGVEGESQLMALVQNSGEFIVEDTHGQDHKGDCVLRIGNRAYCVDSKNHNSGKPVRSSEVMKLVDDVVRFGYDAGVIIAWNELISDPTTNSRVKRTIHYKKINGKTILLISRASELPQDTIISLILGLEHHVECHTDGLKATSDKSIRSLIDIATKEIKKLQAKHKSLTMQINSTITDKQYWTTILTENKAILSSLPQ